MNQGALDRSRFEVIETYVLGTMPAEERVRFEQELSWDPSLSEEVELQRENTLAIEFGGVSRLLRQVGAEHSENGEDRQAAGGAWKQVLKYAAVAAVLLSVAWWLSRPSTNERLYAEYYVADPGLPVPMSATDQHAFYDAMVAYELGDHYEARTKWTTLLRSEPTNDTLRYYIANAALSMGDPSAAIPLFEGLASDPTSAFHDKSQWYLFLAYLNSGQVERLSTIALDEHPIYGERVRAIKAELGR